MFLCIYIDCDWPGHAIQRTVIGLIHRLSPFHHYSLVMRLDQIVKLEAPRRSVTWKNITAKERQI